MLICSSPCGVRCVAASRSDCSSARPETSLDSDPYDESWAPIELLSAASERDAAGHVATIVRHGLRTGVLSRDEAELLLLIAVGYPAAVIARQLGRDPSVIIRRIHKATRAAGRIAAA